MAFPASGSEVVVAAPDLTYPGRWETGRHVTGQAVLSYLQLAGGNPTGRRRWTRDPDGHGAEPELALRLELGDPKCIEAAVRGCAPGCWVVDGRCRKAVGALWCSQPTYRHGHGREGSGRQPSLEPLARCASQPEMMEAIGSRRRGGGKWGRASWMGRDGSTKTPAQAPCSSQTPTKLASGGAAVLQFLVELRNRAAGLGGVWSSSPPATGTCCC